MRITNYEFNLVCFSPVQIFSLQRRWFCLSGRRGSGVIVRRSTTCGYEGYCLSGKFFYCFWLQVVTYCYSGKGGAVDWRPRLRWISAFEDVFWLGKPNFHNRRIHSAGLINIGNLLGRQNIRYSYVTLSCRMNPFVWYWRMKLILSRRDNLLVEKEPEPRHKIP